MSTRRKKEVTESLFRQMQEEVDSVLNRVFDESLREGMTTTSKITDNALREVDRLFDI